MRINVFEGPFEERVAIIQEHLARAQEVWDKEGMGLVVGDVMFLDKTADGLNRNVNVTGGACLQEPYGDRIDVRYVHNVNQGLYGGYATGRSDSWTPVGPARS